MLFIATNPHNHHQFYSILEYIDGLVQDCSISSALAMEILQSCTEPYVFSKATISADSKPDDIWYGIRIYTYLSYKTIS